MAWPLCDYKVISMDCYGTLIDWETGIWNALQPLVSDTDISANDALRAFADAESAQQAASPEMLYPSVLRSVHAELADEFGLPTLDDLDDAFGRSVPDWPAFDDAAEALTRLKRHYQLVILSNVDRAGFAASNERLGIDFDAIFTAEDIGSYKPSIENFEYMLVRLGEQGHSPATDILHVAQSLFHDHVTAERCGLDRVWIDRQRLSDGGDLGATAMVEDQPSVDYTFYSMTDFADAVDKSFAIEEPR